MRSEELSFLCYKMKESVVKDKSVRFAIRVVRLYKYLKEERNEYILSKQLVRSGTSVGANISEAQRAQSTADFSAKMYIALKEAEESAYWILLLKEAEYISTKEYASINDDCEELVKLLTAITKTVSPRNRQ